VIGHCAVGQAVVTGAGNLKAKFVIHVVGPLGSDPDADRLLASACRSAIERAAERHLESIAIPAISTGVFGFPLERAAEILIRTAVEFSGSHEKPERIVFCLWGREAYESFERSLKEINDPS
jgi:O-acetyl-ADP-ribose deacetylase (regulator of RNase III)